MSPSRANQNSRPSTPREPSRRTISAKRPIPRPAARRICHRKGRSVKRIRVIAHHPNPIAATQTNAATEPSARTIPVARSDSFAMKASASARTRTGGDHLRMGIGRAVRRVVRALASRPPTASAGPLASWVDFPGRCLMRSLCAVCAGFFCLGREVRLLRSGRRSSCRRTSEGRS